MSTQGDGARAHYRDGQYYEQAYRRRRADVRFYVQMAEQFGGPVLELGAGTGRVTRALAKKGFDVVGIDREDAMLAHGRERLEKLPAAVQERVELRRGDVRKLRLRRRFSLVVAPFNVFMHLYERRDVEQALSVARRHLRARGRFVFDVLLPDPGSLARQPRKGYRAGHVVHPSDGERYKYTEYFDYDPATQVQHTTLGFEHPTRRRKSFKTPLSQRQFFPQELEALLHYNGFVVEAHYGDFARGPITSASESQVVIARRRG